MLTFWTQVLLGYSTVIKDRYYVLKWYFVKRKTVIWECGAVYQALVTSVGGGVESYIGLAKNFKKRYPKHKKTLLDESADGQTSMSKYYWKEKRAGRDPKVTWRFLEKNVPVYNPVTNKCRLCLREKFNIVLRTSWATKLN